ncbi:MAG: DUF2911 domain-containing protein [Bacteroidia bacterium]
MKNISTLLIAVALLCLGTLQAQMAPAPSPSCKTVQMAGLTEITIDYSRPSMKGRTIFGELVPFDKVWRTGANASTKIEFSTDVTIGGSKVKKGKYALYTKPGKDSWTVMLYTDLSHWGVPNEIKEDAIAAQFKVTPTKTKDSYESLSIHLDHLRKDKAHLVIQWENTKVAIEMMLPADEMVVANIDKMMAGPSSGQYYQAARYYLETNRDLKKAQEWIDKAIELREGAYWAMTIKAKIHKAMGDKAGAKATAMKALEAAKADKNDGYVKQNEEILKSL